MNNYISVNDFYKITDCLSKRAYEIFTVSVPEVCIFDNDHSELQNVVKVWRISNKKDGYILLDSETNSLNDLRTFCYENDVKRKRTL